MSNLKGLFVIYPLQNGGFYQGCLDDSLGSGYYLLTTFDSWGADSYKMVVSIDDLREAGAQLYTDDEDFKRRVLARLEAKNANT